MTMNDQRNKNQPDESNDTLKALLELAGPSAEISREIEDRVYTNVRQEWSRGKSWSKPVRWALPLALAASLLLVVFGLDQPDIVPQKRPVGSVSVVAGDAKFVVGDNVYVGDVVDTSTGRGMSLALKDDISLRIDARTLLKVDSASEFTLLAGRIYIDTGDRVYADRHVTVTTASGSATDVGTQFSVRFENADMSVAVREGRVDLSEGRERHNVTKGKRVTVRPGNVARFESVPLVGEPWDWAVSLVPSFEIEDKSLLDFLKWVSRETGMELIFADDEFRMEVMRPRLHGSIEGMAPIQALEAVLATTKFKHSIDGNTIIISR